MELKYTAASNHGSRSDNQDNLRVSSKLPWLNLTQNYSGHGKLLTRHVQVLCVCDGVGGAAMGDLAARYALEGIEEYISGIGGTEPLDEIALQAAQTAQDRVLAFYDEAETVGGCTLVMAVLRGTDYVILNIGDSPAFHYSRRADELTELSRRHNRAWEKRRSGEAPEPGDECRLLNYLGKFGFDATDMADYVKGTLMHGDSLILCTDGVSESFTDRRLRLALKYRVSAGWITAIAAKSPESDNCTAICVNAKKRGRE